MDSSIILPRNEDLERLEVYLWTEAWYRRTYPELEVVIGLDNGRPFSKARAVNKGVLEAAGRLLIIIDSDTVILRDQLEKGIAAGEWVIPFNQCFNLDEKTTRRWLDNGLDLEDLAFERVRRNFDRAGGVWIITRDIFNLVGGLDERYAGWGGEDDSFCRAVNALYKPLKMLAGDVYHLYHPEAESKAAFARTPNNRLWRRYCRAGSDLERMREILDDRKSHDAD